MGLRIDTQFCNYVSNKLSLFKWVRPNLAVARCPFCGDSAAKQSKKRFYIYQRANAGSLNDGLSCHCHNCSYSQPFGKFLQEFDAGYYSQYRTENFKESGTRRQVVKKPTKTVTPAVPLFTVAIPKPTVLEGIPFATRCDELPDDHIANLYLEYRKIEKPELFWYSENFKQSAIAFNNLSSMEKMFDESRLVIPFYNEENVLECIQGRTLSDKKSGVKYLTVKRSEESRKTYGLHTLDRSKPVWVVEGPIDSLFLPNCLATADSNLLSISFGDKYIPDTQYRNKEICRRMVDIIDAGKNIVLLPSECTDKDINAMIMSGINKQTLWELLETHTYKGLNARLRLSKLRKC